MAIYSLRLLSWSAPEKLLRAKLKKAIFEHRFFATLRFGKCVSMWNFVPVVAVVSDPSCVCKLVSCELKFAYNGFPTE